MGALIGSGGRTLRKLQRDLGVTIRVTSQGPGQPATFTVTGMRHPVMVASEELQRNSANVDDLLSRMGQHFEQEVHCFVDYSNIYIAAQSSRQPGNRQSAFLNAKALKDRVVDERTARKLVVVGSLGSEEQAERCRQEWTSAGFQHVHFVARPAGMGEADLAIDDKIVSEALLSVARDYPKPQKLVILTGDGNDNHGWVCSCASPVTYLLNYFMFPCTYCLQQQLISLCFDLLYAPTPPGFVPGPGGDCHAQGMGRGALELEQQRGPSVS